MHNAEVVTEAHGLQCGILQENSSLQGDWSIRSYWWLRTSYHQPLNNLFYFFSPISTRIAFHLIRKQGATSVALVHSTSGINPPKFLFLCSHGNWKPFTREYCQFLMLCCRPQYSSQRQRVTSKSLSEVSFSTKLPVNKVPFLPTYSATQLSVWKGGRGKSCSVFTA